ncbi:MAG: tRNA lysidine(34) synthetase TilS [Paenibacillaceae bacterium]
MELVRKVDQLIQDEHLLDTGDSIIVAVSGGPDSVALLHILFLLAESRKWRLIVAHFNHQFRGEESDREADFVADYAGRLGLPCEVGVVDVPKFIRESHMNGQAASRELRYAFLLQIAEKYQAKRIALAHHADDQAETLLMRLVRGTGTLGLTGIPIRRWIKNVELIRPFLRIYKSEVLQHCEQHGLSFCLDSSNALNKYVRNQIRHELIPLLKQYNPQLPEALNRLADVMGLEDDYFMQEVDAAYQKLVVEGPNGLQLPRSGFGLMHPALQRRLIKLILSYLAPNASSFDFLTTEKVRFAIMQDTPTTLTLTLGANIQFTREYEQIFFQLKTIVSSGYHYIFESGEGQLELPDGMLLSYFVNGCNEHFSPKLSRTHEAACFDMDLLRFPLSVRNRQDGDRMEIRGLNGTKKVKDIFIDAKLPQRLRNQVPLIVDAAERVLWIPGFRRSVHAIASSHTTRLLCMELHRTK